MKSAWFTLVAGIAAATTTGCTEGSLKGQAKGTPISDFFSIVRNGGNSNQFHPSSGSLSAGKGGGGNVGPASALQIAIVGDAFSPQGATAYAYGTFSPTQQEVAFTFQLMAVIKNTSKPVMGVIVADGYNGSRNVASFIPQYFAQDDHSMILVAPTQAHYSEVFNQPSRFEPFNPNAIWNGFGAGSQGGSIEPLMTRNNSNALFMAILASLIQEGLGSSLSRAQDGSPNIFAITYSMGSMAGARLAFLWKHWKDTYNYNAPLGEIHLLHGGAVPETYTNPDKTGWVRPEYAPPLGIGSEADAPKVRLRYCDKDTVVKPDESVLLGQLLRGAGNASAAKVDAASYSKTATGADCNHGTWGDVLYRVDGAPGIVPAYIIPRLQ